MDSTPQQVPSESFAVSRPQSNPTESDRGKTTPGSGPTSGTSARPMPYNCQSCVRRKVKCDKTIPACSACVKIKQQCLYQAPPKPRRKKRRASDDDNDGHLAEGERRRTRRRSSATGADDEVHERLARYERMLKENGLLDDDGNVTSSCAYQKTGQYPTPIADGGFQPPSRPPLSPLRNGKLVAGDGKSRYIDSHLWLDSGAEDIQDMSDDAETGTELASFTPGLYDPISGALLGLTHNLLEFHPSHDLAMKLWTAHMQNVEPLCRILHIPTTAKMVEAVSRQPSTASKAQECQLFAIYHFAVYTTDEEDCLRQFGQPRSVLLPRYAHAVRQALVNASWLKTTEMPVMQAFMLFLIAGRSYIDPHTYWMLAGIGVRIAQRMGLHHDGESLGLPPFEVQMRRRLFWQLIPLDGFAGQHSGTGISMLPSSWDVKRPLNVNDDQIYPGMTQWPEEQQGATDMIYVLCRVELSNYYSKVALKPKETGPSIHLEEGPRDAQIDEVEQTIEARFLRYCDIIDPLHYLLLIIVRSAANVVRLRSRIKPLKNHTINDTQRRELCGIAQKILDADSAIYRAPNLKNFRWQVKEFFLWDALICMLTSLTQPDFFSREELDKSWAKLTDLWNHHPELLETWRPVHIMAGKAILKAWTANPPTECEPEPYFITTLKVRYDKASRARAVVPTDVKELAEDAGHDVEDVKAFDAAAVGDWSEAGMLIDSSLSSGVGDFVFWDQFFLNAEMSQGTAQGRTEPEQDLRGAEDRML